MAKVRIKVYYVITSETEPGIFDEVEEVKEKTGEWVKRGYSYSSAYPGSDSQINSAIISQNVITFLSDSYSLKNHKYIKYVEVDGVKFECMSIYERPRIKLYLGAVRDK